MYSLQSNHFDVCTVENYHCCIGRMPSVADPVIIRLPPPKKGIRGWILESSRVQCKQSISIDSVPYQQMSQRSPKMNLGDHANHATLSIINPICPRLASSE